VTDFPSAVRVVDSHTEGEPTRVVVEGWPQLGARTMAERRDLLNRDYDALRSAVVCEPRGHDAMVGALLTPPEHAGSSAGVIFFNNVGCLGMCGHGTIGVVQTLRHLGTVRDGIIRLDTPVGTVSAELAANGVVTVTNVPSRVHALDVSVAVPGMGEVTGDIAYGGNWFFIVHTEEELRLTQVADLTARTEAIMASLAAAGITGEHGARIDHVELSGPPGRADADSRNFVLCPGGAYDRSPCGTGTSARMATLHARGQLPPGQRWRQESITGSLFTGWLEPDGDLLVPHISGRAWITGESVLRFAGDDPFRAGFTAAR
jgi:4-hydroxyproline epimerase